MHTIIDFTLIPIGAGVSVSPYIAACQRVLEEAGLTYQLHPNGTGVEGEWDEVFAAVRRCHEVVHEMGSPRVHTCVQIGTRTDRTQSMADKASSVTRRLAEG